MLRGMWRQRSGVGDSVTMQALREQSADLGRRKRL
jgi:hypothetical protein